MSKSSIPVCVSCFGELEEVDRGRTRHFLESIEELPEIEFAAALWYYDPGSPVRSLHRAFKYGGLYRIGFSLGILLGMHLEHTLNGRHKPELIVPIPVHRIRRAERGYNQAEAIAAGVAEILALPVETGVLIRERLRGSQTGLDRASRMLNLADAFALKHPDRIEGRHCLLIDDVITTGATIVAAARTLVPAEPHSCSIAALALVRPPGKLTENLQRRPDRRRRRLLPDRSSQ